jgi:hypothetical protein
MPRKPSLDPNVLAAALEGLEAQRQRLEEQIARVRAMLGTRTRTARSATATAAPEAPRRRRKMSAAARRNIIEAQKKRWAEFRKQQAANAKPKKPVRGEVMKKRLAALAKARAARAAKRAARRRRRWERRKDRRQRWAHRASGSALSVPRCPTSEHRGADRTYALEGL